MRGQFRTLEIANVSADLAQTRHGFCCPEGTDPIRNHKAGVVFDGSPTSLACFCDLLRLTSS